MKNNKVTNIKDVAKIAKVSIATIDRVIHNRKGVSKKTQEIVKKVIKDLNYKPNVLASNLSKKKKFVFALLLPNSSEKSTYWDLPLKGVSKALKEIEQHSIKIETYLYDHGDLNSFRKQILSIINSDIDGLVMTPKFASETKILLQDCKEKDRPYVFIDSNTEEDDSLCSIQQPLFQSGQLAGQLFNYNFKKGKILAIHLKDTMDSDAIIDTKIKGVSNYLKEINSEVSIKKKVFTNFDEANIKTNMDILLDDEKDIKGIFIPNSKTSYIAAYLTQRKGNKIPLIGYDLLKENTQYIENDTIDYLICQKPEMQGYKAVYKLFEYLVLRKEVDKKIMMPLDIITKNNYKYY